MQPNFISYVLLFFFSLSNFSLPPHACSAIDNVLINCGSFRIGTLDNRQFMADFSKYSRSFESDQDGPISDLGHVDQTPSIYDSNRYSEHAMSYRIHINENGTHIVRLHFDISSYSKEWMRCAKFDVLVNDYVVLRDFHRHLSSMTLATPRNIMEYFIWVDTEESYTSLVITFVPNPIGFWSNFAFVHAIEVISAPKDLVPDTALYVTPNGTYNLVGLAKQALQVVYRVNVGGPKILCSNDSLWRTWVYDDEFLKSRAGSEVFNYNSDDIEYQTERVSHETGPRAVYSSARLTRRKNMNLTWEFPVSGEYKYLIRLHFCDIVSRALGWLHMNVFANGILAYKNLDPSNITKSLASPFYIDFVVDGDNSTGILNLTVGPSKRRNRGKIQAILNGIEIMKVNNSNGSIDGEVSAPMIMGNYKRETDNACLVLIAILICSLLSFLMFIYCTKVVVEVDDIYKEGSITVSWPWRLERWLKSRIAPVDDATYSSPKVSKDVASCNQLV